jgi:hypothetical protein
MPPSRVRDKLTKREREIVRRFMDGMSIERLAETSLAECEYCAGLCLKRTKDIESILRKSMLGKGK